MFGINPAEHRKCADEENQKEFLTGALSETFGKALCSVFQPLELFTAGQSVEPPSAVNAK